MIFQRTFIQLNNIKGFMYQGIKLHIESLIIFLIFALIPSENISNIYIIKIIKIFTNYTYIICIFNLQIFFKLY